GDDRPRARLQHESGSFTSMAFSPDGRRLATMTTAPKLVLWDAATARPLSALFPEMTGAIAALMFNHDGSLLAGGGGGRTVWVWAPSSGRVAAELSTAFWITSLAFSPDGRFLAAGGGTPGSPGEIQVWKLPGGQPACECRGHTDVVQCLTFSPQGNRLISGSTDQTIKVWELIGGQETLALRGHSGPVRGLAFSTEGQQLVSATQDGALKSSETPAIGFTN